ncbi:MAG: hypothetical protein ABIN17_00895 [candidate division WOR-3 bacterium]
MYYEVCLRCGSEIDRKGFFCQNCGFFISKDFTEKELLVFRMDIIGFTHLTEKIELFDLKINLSLLFSNLRNIAEKNGGYVNQYIGDEIEILWGLVKKFEKAEFFSFLKDIKDFFNSKLLKVNFRMHMFGGYGNTIVFPVKTGEKAYLILISDFINKINDLKTIVKEGEIGLIGEPEKIFEGDMLEKRSFDNFNFYILREVVLHGAN